MARNAPTVPRVEGPVFLVVGHDAPGSAQVRDEQLEGHLDYVEQNCERYLVCGPLHSDDGKSLIGSYFLVNVETAEAARALVAGDPYVINGTYAELTVTPATAAAGRMMGGVIWESAEQIRARAAAAE